MDIKQFLAENEGYVVEVNKDDVSKSEFIELFNMSAPHYQGTINFIPIEPLRGPIIKYLYDVDEFRLYHGEDGKDFWFWGKLPQIKDFEELSEKEIKLHNEILQYLIKADKMNLGPEWMRMKNYSLIFGYILSSVDTEGNININKENRKYALIVLPSKSVAKAMVTFIKQLNSTDIGQDYLKKLFNRELKRNCFVELNFNRSNIGYSVSFSAKTFDVFTSALLTKEEMENGNIITLNETLVNKMISQINRFIGNEETGKDFNYGYYENFLKQLSSEVNKRLSDIGVAENLPPLENKNIPTDTSWNSNSTNTINQILPPPGTPPQPIPGK